MAVTICGLAGLVLFPVRLTWHLVPLVPTLVNANGTARDGFEAVEVFKGRRYDLILMDMQMPGQDGLETTRQIRAMPEGRTVPILAMTANAFAEDRRRCLEAGMDDFLTKPVELAVLYQKLAHWLSLSRAADQGS